MRKRLTIKEFAKQIGVSTATVSRAFDSKGRISEETRKRIRKLAQEKAENVAETVGMTSLLSLGADSLTVAGRKRLELARALATSPKLLLLDEVMAGLNPTEIDEIVDVIKGIRDT